MTCTLAAPSSANVMVMHSPGAHRRALDDIFWDILWRADFPPAIFFLGPTQLRWCPRCSLPIGQAAGVPRRKVSSRPVILPFPGFVFGPSNSAPFAPFHLLAIMLQFCRSDYGELWIFCFRHASLRVRNEAIFAAPLIDDLGKFANSLLQRMQALLEGGAHLLFRSPERLLLSVKVVLALSRWRRRPSSWAVQFHDLGLSSFARAFSSSPAFGRRGVGALSGRPSCSWAARPLNFINNCIDLLMQQAF